MLILTRRIGQAVRIGEEVTITVVRINRNQVSIGVNAPTSVPVHRQEVFERIKTQSAERGTVYKATAR